jgi:hypothetical protein
MTLDEAIRQNENTVDKLKAEGFPTRARAVRLGNEALKRIQECRLADYMIKEDLLPGETKE